MGSRGTAPRLIILLIAFTVLVLSLSLVRRRGPVLEVGESLLYEVSGGANGKLVFEVPKLLTFRGEHCYQVSFSFLVENRSRVGDMLITQHGELKQLRVAEGGLEGNSLGIKEGRGGSKIRGG